MKPGPRGRVLGVLKCPLTATPRSPLLWPVLVAAAAAAAHLAVAVRGDRFVATVGEARLAAATFAARGAELGDITLPCGGPVRRAAVRRRGDAPAHRQLSGGRRHEVRRPGVRVPVCRAAVACPARPRDGAGARRRRGGTGRGGAPGRRPACGHHRRRTGDDVARRGGGAGRVRPAARRAGRRRGRDRRPHPLAAAALLVLAAHLAHDRVLGGRLPTAARLPAVVAMGAAAVGVATAAAGNGPLAGIGGPVVGLGATLTVVAVGVVLSWLAWTQHPQLRPALTPAVLLLAVALVPGAARSAALLLVLPFLAVVFALLAEPVVATLADRSTAVPAVPVTALALATVVGLLAVVNTAPTPPTGLAGWVSSEIDPNVALRADPLDRAELSASGIAAERLRDLGEPGAAGRPDGGDGPAGDRCRRRGRAPLRRDRHAGRRSARSRRRPHVGVPGRPARPGDRGGRAGGPGPVRRRARAQPVARTAAGGGRRRCRPGWWTRGWGACARPTSASRSAGGEDFPVEPLEPPYALRRHVLLGAVDGLPASGDPSLGHLHLVRRPAERPFVPNSIEVQGEALLIGYPAPTPTGLIACSPLEASPARTVAAARQVRRCVSTESSGMRRTKRRPVPRPFLSVGNRTVLVCSFGTPTA